MIHQIAFIYLASQIACVDFNMKTKIALIDSTLSLETLEICLEDIGLLMD